MLWQYCAPTDPASALALEERQQFPFEARRTRFRPFSPRRMSRAYDPKHVAPFIRHRSIHDERPIETMPRHLMRHFANLNARIREAREAA